jgi:hypothetical protein
MKHIRHGKFIIGGFYLTTFILLLATNPKHLSLTILLVPLLLFFIAFYFTVRWIILRLKATNKTFSSKKASILAVLITGLPFLCVLLQSIGQFSVRDFITLVVLFGVLYFYLMRGQVFS